MAKLIDNRISGTDVTFIFYDESKLEAHRLVLCCASSLFCRIFLSNTALSTLRSLDPEVKLEGKLTSKDINGNRVAGLVQVSSDRNIPYDCVYFEECQRIVFTLTKDLPKQAVNDVLKFMYTGELDLSDASEEKHLNAVLDVARIFQVESLVDLLKDDDDMSTHGCAEKWKKDFVLRNQHLFCNKSRFSDVSFEVDSQILRAHMPVLISRCDFMAAMLSGKFQESGQSQVRCFKIYTLRSKSCWIFPYFQFSVSITILPAYSYFSYFSKFAFTFPRFRSHLHACMRVRIKLPTHDALM